jgi:hypothetical protein
MIFELGPQLQLPTLSSQYILVKNIGVQNYFSPF